MTKSQKSSAGRKFEVTQDDVKQSVKSLHETHLFSIAKRGIQTYVDIDVINTGRDEWIASSTKGTDYAAMSRAQFFTSNIRLEDSRVKSIEAFIKKAAKACSTLERFYNDRKEMIEDLKGVSLSRLDILTRFLNDKYLPPTEEAKHYRALELTEMAKSIQSYDEFRSEVMKISGFTPPEGPRSDLPMAFERYRELVSMKEVGHSKGLQNKYKRVFEAVGEFALKAEVLFHDTRFSNYKSGSDCLFTILEAAHEAAQAGDVKALQEALQQLQNALSQLLGRQVIIVIK